MNSRPCKLKKPDSISVFFFFWFSLLTKTGNTEFTIVLSGFGGGAHWWKDPPSTAHLGIFFFFGEGHSPLLLTGVPDGSSDCNAFVHKPLFPHTPYQIRPFRPALAPSRPNKKKRKKRRKKKNPKQTKSWIYLKKPPIPNLAPSKENRHARLGSLEAVQ